MTSFSDKNQNKNLSNSYYLYNLGEKDHILQIFRTHYKTFYTLQMSATKIRTVMIYNFY